jgi:hypothetical protein
MIKREGETQAEDSGFVEQGQHKHKEESEGGNIWVRLSVKEEKRE